LKLGRKLADHKIIRFSLKKLMTSPSKLVNYAL